MTKVTKSSAIHGLPSLVFITQSVINGNLRNGAPEAKFAAARHPNSCHQPTMMDRS